MGRPERHVIVAIVAVDAASAVVVAVDAASAAVVVIVVAVVDKQGQERGQ